MVEGRTNRTHRQTAGPAPEASGSLFWQQGDVQGIHHGNMADRENFSFCYLTVTWFQGLGLALEQVVPNPVPSLSSLLVCQP